MSSRSTIIHTCFKVQIPMKRILWFECSVTVIRVERVTTDIGATGTGHILTQHRRCWHTSLGTTDACYSQLLQLKAYNCLTCTVPRAVCSSSTGNRMGSIPHMDLLAPPVPVVSHLKSTREPQGSSYLPY